MGHADGWGLTQRSRYRPALQREVGPSSAAAGDIVKKATSSESVFMIASSTSEESGSPEGPAGPRLAEPAISWHTIEVTSCPAGRPTDRRGRAAVRRGAEIDLCTLGPPKKCRGPTPLLHESF